MSAAQDDRAPDGKRLMKVSYQALAAMGVVQDPLTATPWEVARPAPGVLPRGMTQLAQDDAVGSLYAYAQAAASTDGLQFLGYTYLAELAQRPEYRRISETIAKEMTRKWIRLHGTGNDDKSDKIRVLNAALKKFRVQQCFRRLAELDGFFGRGQLFLDTGYSENPDELATPLVRDPRKIGRNGLKRLKVVEPLWTYPADYNTNDPLDQNFYRPRMWFVQGRRVHRSRLLSFVSREVPDMLKPAYAFGGVSLSQMARPYVENWLRTRQSVADLIHSFSVSGLKTNLTETLNGLGEDMLMRRAELFNRARDNRGIMLLDRDSEEFFNVSTPLGTLDHLQAQSQEHMASVSGIPLVVLLGVTPSGLNASSDGEIKTFYAWIAAQQEQLFDDHLGTVLEVIQLSEFGHIDPAITFSWEPLWALDDAAKSNMRKTDADVDLGYLNAGVLSPEEVRCRIADSEDTLYPGLDPANIPAPPADPMAEAPIDPMAEAEPDAANENAPAAPPPPPPPPEPKQLTKDAVLPTVVRGAARPHPGLIKAAPRRPVAIDREFAEEDHPRGQPGNPGQFGPGGGGASKPAKAKPAASKPAAPQQAVAPAQAPGQTQSQTSGQTAPQAAPAAGSAAKPGEKVTRWTGLSPTKLDGKVRTQADGAPLPAHVLAMKIPPGYTQVAFNPDPNAALVAMAKDNKNRDVPYYRADLMAENADAKFNRVMELSAIADHVVQRNEQARQDAARADTADCFSLVFKMGVRPGSEKDTGAKHQAYGATTLQGRHVVTDEGGKVSLQFVGKEGQNLNLPVEDPQLAAMLTMRARKTGADGKLFPTTSADKLLQHTKAVTGDDKYKSKDFRTLLGTRTAASLVAAMPKPSDAKTYQKAVMDIAKHVSAKLGNKPQMALKAYINPTVFSAWEMAQ